MAQKKWVNQASYYRSNCLTNNSIGLQIRSFIRQLTESQNTSQDEEIIYNEEIQLDGYNNFLIFGLDTRDNSLQGT